MHIKSLVICNGDEFDKVFDDALKGVFIMPSKSKPQARLMAAAAHTKGGYGGVPQKVGREFNEADKGTGILKGKQRQAPRSKGKK